MEDNKLTNQKGKLKPKSRELVQEAADIVRNSEDDQAAISFLQDTLEDDYPDMELGSMDLHEAIKTLGFGEEKGKVTGAGNRDAIENLSKALGSFMNKSGKPSKSSKPSRPKTETKVKAEPKVRAKAKRKKKRKKTKNSPRV